MELLHTKNLMETKCSVQFLDSYAVLASISGRQALITSPDVDEDTYFDIASMGKVLITATLILHALGEGRLSLTDTLPVFFQNVPEDKQHITLRDLLTHSSGIVRFEFPPEAADETHDQLAARILERPLAYPTGTDYIYSCHGYILLGFVVEKLYSMPLDQVYEQLLKGPLGLTRSRFNVPPIGADNAAECHYTAEPDAYRSADTNVRIMKGVAGSGASFWTMHDVQRFTQAVMNKEACLYPENLFALAEQDYTPRFGEGRGLGWLITDERYAQTGRLFPKGSFGHCGNTGTSFFMNREKDLYVIILTNATRRGYERKNWKGLDYGEIMAMREEIHNTILQDLQEQGLA